jgi:ABC-2 type transport system ATP-binding protein
MTAFGLADLADRAVASYSGGQRRRLEIARALVSRPRILFLDEPTVGLDPRIRYELLDLIAGLRMGSDLTVLLTTHYLDEAERLCDRVAIVHAGRIVALDTPAALLARLGDQILELRVQDDPRAALELFRATGVAREGAFSIGSTLTIPLRSQPAGEAISAIRRTSVAIGAVTTRAPTLDDVYLQLTGQSLTGERSRPGDLEAA